MTTHAANRLFIVMVLAGTLAGAPAWAAQRGSNQNSRPDTPGTGPYPAMKEEIPALPRHVAYRPAVANLPVGHGGTYSEPNGGAAAQVAVAWLNWQLRGDAKAAAYVECAVGDRVLWGVGLHSSIVKASLTAVLSAVNRAEREQVGHEDEREVSRPGGGP